MPPGENVGHGMPLSDDFSSSTLGIQWTYGRNINPDEFFRPSNGRLSMKASFGFPTNATTLSVMPVNHAYEAEVELSIPDTAEGGLMLSSGKGSGSRATVGLRKAEAFAIWGRVDNYIKWNGNHIFVLLRNNRGDVSCYYSTDGKQWTPFENSTGVSGARRLSLYAAGEGEVVFRNFKYRVLE